MDALHAAYVIAFLVGGGLGVLSWLLGHHGHGGHGHGHFHGHAHGHPQGVRHWQSMPYVNMMSLSALCCAGGGTGLIAERLGLAALVGLAWAVGVGLGAAFAINTLLAWLARGTHYVAPLPQGIVGTVVSRVGPGVGEIVYVQNGARAALPARSENGKAIDRGTEIIVLGIENGIARVAPAAELLKKEDEQ